MIRSIALFAACAGLTATSASALVTEVAFVNYGSTSTPNSGGEAFVSVVDGGVHTSARLYAQGNSGTSDVYSANLFTVGLIQDDIVIDAPGLTGTSGSLMTHAFIEGFDSLTMAVTGDGWADYHGHALIQVDGGGVMNFANDLVTPGSELFLNGYTLDTAIPFTYGTPFSLSFQASLWGTARASGSARVEFTQDFSQSAYWGGISNVLDASGGSVSGYSLISSSDFDWNRSYVPKQVPDGGITGLLAAIALLALGVAQRRIRGNRTSS